MKRLITLCLALVMALSLGATVGNATSELPSAEERFEALRSGEVTYEEAMDMGWIDDEVIAIIDDNATSASSLGGDDGQSGAMLGSMIPSKMPVRYAYDYAYMGLHYVLPPELRDMLRSGKAWTQNGLEMDGDTDFRFSTMFFLLAEDGNPGRDFASYDEYDAWYATTQRFGAITVVREDFLNETSIEYISGCKENTEIGRSSDGKYVFFFSTNDVGAITELFKETTVTFSDPVQIPSSEDDPYFIGIMSDVRQDVSDLGDFKAQNVDGVMMDNSIFAEYDLTMVNLWTTTCGYCIQEMPDLEAIRADMQSKGIKFNIVGMCLDVNHDGSVNEDRLAKVRDIIQKTGIQYETLLPDDVLWNGRLKGVNAFPETFFVDKDGKIVGDTILGSNTRESWQEIIDETLAGLGK